MGALIDSSVLIDRERAKLGLAIGFDLATHDTRSFPRVPGLKILAW